MIFIVADLECTCWNDGSRRPSEIIEIGAIKLENGEKISEFQAFIKPKIFPTLSRFCIRLTSITQAEVDSAEDFVTVITKFKEWIGEDDFTFCSWGRFDINEIISQLTRHEMDHEWISAKMFLNVKRLHGRVRQLPGTGIGMAKAVQMEFEHFEGIHHRGIDDAHNTANIFIKYFDEFSQETDPQFSRE